MKAEVLKQQKADLLEIGACYEQAVKLTVPDIEQLNLGKSLLSIQEVNMILEYEFYHKDEKFLQKCAALMTYVSDSVYDELSKVKIYPKIVYYYLREVFSGSVLSSPEWVEESLQVCNCAIEMLRNTGRAFYLIELLEAKCKLFEIIETNQEEYIENTELIELFRKLYCEYDVPVYMQDCVYLYRQRWVFYIGDVLRIRRKMYGLTQEELCKGICVPKTLRRTERMKRNMQQNMLGAVMRRLGLSKEYQRVRLVTNDEDVVRLYEELNICRNNFDVKKARYLFNQIEEKISLNIPENKQYFIDIEASLDWMEGKINKEEFALREEKALQCTLNIDDLPDINEIFLTEMEMSCIRKRMRGLEKTEKGEYIKLLLRFFEQYERKKELSDCISMYEFVMVSMANELGNMDKHQSAINIDKKIIKESLKCKRLWAVSNSLYDILWNESEQAINEGDKISKDKMTEGLRQCIAFSHFCRQIYIEKFLCEKLHQS